MPTALVLSVLAVLLAGPLPTLLARAARLRRVPRAAMVLWQAVALGAVLSALGAGLSLVTSPVLGPGRGPGNGGDPAYRYAVGLVALVALGLTALVLGRLLLSGHRVGTRIRSLRRRHRALLDLLATDDAGVAVLDHDAPMAYCVPGVQSSRVVVSASARRLLAPEELDAVLAHERAHLRARHDLVLEAFSVLHAAFPAGVRSGLALAEVRFLVEVLADRAAARRVGARPLARALVALAESQTPEATLGLAGHGLAERITLLREDRDPSRLDRVLDGVLALVAVAAALAVLAVPTAFVVLPWLAEVSRRFPGV